MDMFNLTMSIPLVSRGSLIYMEQLALEFPDKSMPWALHADGVHKLHIGSWVLVTFGTHCLRFDEKLKVHRHR